MKARYGEEEGNKLWELINRQYDKYLEDLPDYPPVEELQELVTKLFMSGFVKLGKFFNLNRSFDMWLINKVFQKIGEKDRKLYAQYPACFCNAGSHFSGMLTPEEDEIMREIIREFMK